MTRFALLRDFTEAERIGAAGRTRLAKAGGGVQRLARRAGPATAERLEPLPAIADAGARMLAALDPEIEAVFKGARKEHRREPRQPYAWRGSREALEATSRRQTSASPTRRWEPAAGRVYGMNVLRHARLR